MTHICTLLVGNGLTLRLSFDQWLPVISTTKAKVINWVLQSLEPNAMRLTYASQSANIFLSASGDGAKIVRSSAQHWAPEKRFSQEHPLPPERSDSRRPSRQMVNNQNSTHHWRPESALKIYPSGVQIAAESYTTATVNEQEALAFLFVIASQNDLLYRKL